MNYLYHMIPKMRGNILMPLNALKERYPNIAAKHLEKYHGREKILSQRIPPLNCLWNDVLHFTAVHPKKTHAALKKAGFEGLLTRRWFKIDPRLIDPHQTTVFLYNDEIERDAKENFTTFSIGNLSQYNAIGRETSHYYREKRAREERPLLFHLIPHILYKGNLDISDLEVIEI